MSRLGSAYALHMPRPPKVVPITEQKPKLSAPKLIAPKLVAEDERTKRVIIAIGQQRLAFDFTTRITHLPPNTGDQPAAVLPLKARGADPCDHTLAGTLERGEPQKSPRGTHPGERKRRTRP